MKFHKTCYPHLSSINSPLNQILLLLNHHFRTFFHNRRSSILFPETAAHRSGAVWALTPKVREGSRTGGKTDCLKGQPGPKTCTSQAVARQSDPHGKTSPTNGLHERCFKWTEISVNISLQKKNESQKWRNYTGHKVLRHRIGVHSFDVRSSKLSVKIKTAQVWLVLPWPVAPLSEHS